MPYSLFEIAGIRTPRTFSIFVLYSGLYFFIGVIHEDFSLAKFFGAGFDDSLTLSGPTFSRVNGVLFISDSLRI
jgi:hypothetical protein